MGWVKIKTDKARKNDSRVGGGVIRRSDHEWIGAFSKCM